jgi:hypothetical protein
MVRKLQIRKLPRLLKVRKSKKQIKSANLQICDCGTYLQTSQL